MCTNAQRWIPPILVVQPTFAQDSESFAEYRSPDNIPSERCTLVEAFSISYLFFIRHDTDGIKYEYRENNNTSENVKWYGYLI